MDIEDEGSFASSRVTKLGHLYHAHFLKEQTQDSINLRNYAQTKAFNHE